MYDGVQRCTRCAARKEYVVNQQHIPIIDRGRPGQRCRARDGTIPIVSVFGYIKVLHTYGMPFIVMNVRGERLGKTGSSAADPHNDQIFHSPIMLYYFESQSIDRPADAFSRQNQGSRHTKICAAAQEIY